MPQANSIAKGCRLWATNFYVTTNSVFRYGFETAKELAIKFRARKERELPHYANALQLNELNFDEFDDDDDDQFYFTFFFCPIDLVINNQLAIRVRLKNGPLDSIDINCHGGSHCRRNVEETVLQVLKPNIYWVFDQFRGVSIYLLEEY